MRQLYSLPSANDDTAYQVVARGSEVEAIDLTVLGKLLRDDSVKIAIFALKFVSTARAALAEIQAAYSVKGVFLYLYLVLDIYSRKIVGWQVYEEERSALAADSMTDIRQREGVKRDQVTLHS
jgi:transposase InsO family protein